MLEFTPTPEDAVDLAQGVAEENASDARGRAYFWVIGLCATALLGTIAGWGVGVLLGDPGRRPAGIGLIVGAVAWLLLMAVQPDLRRVWSRRRTARKALRDYRDRGTVRVWLDDTGVNSTVGLVHRRLSWPGIHRVTVAGDHILVMPRYAGPVLTVPRRIGDAVVDRLAATIREHLTRVRPTTGTRSFTPTGTALYPRRVACLDIDVTTADLCALAASIEHRQPPTRVRRDFRLVQTVRAFVVSFVVLVAINRATIGFPNPIILGSVLLPSVLIGAAIWYRSAGAYTRQALAQAEAEAPHRLAAGGTHRQLWLDETGFGQEDAVTVEHAAWPVLTLEETREHWFLHAVEDFDAVIPRRILGADAFAAAVRAQLATGRGAA